LIRNCLCFKADIRADTNRDGVVDVAGDTDVNGKDAWTDTSGAIFLANIGDTDRRCSIQALQGPTPSNEGLAACNDASDDILRQAEYLAPMRTLPMPDLGDNAVGTVSTNPTSSKNVRIFRRDEADSWTFVRANTTFTSAQLKAGLELGIDARDVRRPGGWDGRTTVTFAVTDGTTNSTDKLMLRVAPVLSHTHLQRVDQVLTTAGNVSEPDFQQQFVVDLSRVVASKGIAEPVFTFPNNTDIWAQDFVEPGYTNMPGPNGTISMRIMIRSGQDDRDAGRQVFEHLRGTGVGAVHHPGGDFDGVSSMGNFETIPPYEHNGTKWPAGRVIMGSQGTKNHHDLEFMRAQEVQNPLLLDTNWLVVGHVDEFVQFVPANTTRGWAIVIGDPEAGLELLRGVQRRALGSTKAFSRVNDPGAVTLPPPGSGSKPNDTSSGGDEGLGGNFTYAVPQLTVDDLLADQAMVHVNSACAGRIAANIAILKDATGITDEEIYRLPAVYANMTENSTAEEPFRVGAYYPGIVNGIMLSDTDYLAPKPWGPLVDGQDVFEQAAKAVYAKAGLTVTFMDDWNTHHNGGGEIHCGTNTVRQTNEPWWQTSESRQLTRRRAKRPSALDQPPMDSQVNMLAF
jgi:protein-arginine deiminase